MADQIRLRDGEIELDSMIDALEAEASTAEILDALKSLRADKIKKALGRTVRASQFDRDEAVADFLADGNRSDRSIQTYRHELNRLFTWLDRQRIHALELRRKDVLRYRRWLENRLQANSVRLALSVGSSWYKWLEAERLVDGSPFVAIPYPKKQYKKAVRPDEGSPTPVMNDTEFSAIVSELERRAYVDAQTHAESVGSSTVEHRSIPSHAESVARESARRLLPLVHIMGEYGLRIGDVLTARIEGSDLSARTKGGVYRHWQLSDDTLEVLAKCGATRRSPFSTYVLGSVQNAIKKLTRELHERGAIRHAYSCHDFRHYFAVNLYRETHDIFRVMKALGHASVSITQTYLAGLLGDDFTTD